MSVISTTRGNPQASDVAVQTATPMLGGASREDLQTVISGADSEIAKLFEDRNFSLVGGGLITFTGTQLQFTEALTLHINSQVAGGAPTVISLGSSTRSLSANNRMLYAVINRTGGTATVTDDATTLAAVTSANQEVVLIGKRVDAGDGTQRFYFRNGSTYNAGQTARLGSSGSGSGSGEINEISNPSDATNWTTSGAGMTVATTTTTSDLPLNGVISTAIKFTPVSGTDYARYRWTMPTALLSKRHKIAWFQHPLVGYTAGDIKVEVYTNTASDYTGTYTELPLYKDVSGDSLIPAGDGAYDNAFDATSTLYYEIRFVRVSGTTALNITNLVVGPGIQATGPVVETPTTIALTYDNLGTVTTNAATSTRTGGRAKVQGRVTTGTIVAGTPAIVLPTGMTVNTGSSGLSTDAAGQQVGYVTLLAATASDVDQVVRFALFFDGSTTNKLFISERSNTGAFKKHNATDFLANGDVLSFEFDIPVGEWSGSGTLSAAGNSIDYLYNSDTSTSVSDTTSFAYGSGGASFVAIASAGTTVKKRVRAQRPMSATAGKPVLEVSPNGTNWFKAETILAYMESGTERYGMRVVAGGTTLTDVDVEFGGDGANGTEAWSAYTSWFWRVTIEQPGIAVGYGVADATTTGFISATSQTVGGAKTWNDIQTWMAAAGTVSAGSYNASGAWTFGPSTPPAAMHNIKGVVQIGGVSTSTWTGVGSFTAASSDTTYVPYFLVSSYPTGSSSARAQYMANNAGSTFWALGSDSSGNTVFGTVSNAGTGIITQTNGLITQTGAWTFGPTSGSTLTHNVNGKLFVKPQTALDATQIVNNGSGQTINSAGTASCDFNTIASAAGLAIFSTGGGASAIVRFSSSSTTDISNGIANVTFSRPTGSTIRATISSGSVTINCIIIQA